MPDLTAGHLSAALAGAELRDVRVAGHPALDAVYVAVRDESWRTVPGEVTARRTAGTAEGTITELEVRHRFGGIGFRWRGTIETSADVVRFTMDGVAESDFDANRIGFGMLHPQALKGRPLRVCGSGGELTGTFPGEISPARLFTGVTSMTYGVGDGAELEIQLDGDLFEIEDHRNWSDPGWKTYCTPLSAPQPVHHTTGQHTRQSVELRAWVPRVAARRRRAGGAARLEVGSAVIGAIPPLGLGASCLPPARAAARDVVRGLRPAHLHVELEDGGPWESRLELALAEAAGLGVPLDVALVATAGRVAALARHIAHHAGELGRVSVFSPVRHSTDAGTVAAARAVFSDLGRSVPLGGGSRAHFAELNRGDFDLASWDFVTYGLTPQVHHAGGRSVLATEAAIADGLAQAKTIARGLPVVTGPITLRPRFNAAAARAEPLPAADDDGPDVDERQHTQLAALYLAAAVSRLAGAYAATAFRTIGRRGVVAADGTPAPAARVVAALTSLAGSAVRRTASPGTVVGLAAATPAGLSLLVTNLAPQSTPLELAGAKATEADVLGGGALNPHRLVLPGHSVTSIRAVEA
ncbi:MAG: hypothetical protein ACRDOU_12780 [Streptosporangiaceae bacterium]